ncbi:g11050 [Coccomyxa viridis]|uniref:G11050 protein n=1 Tax=Coccomyxa viridis TaxID=1274662 RepID=A0ABP1GB67_9CHLO
MGQMSGQVLQSPQHTSAFTKQMPGRVRRRHAASLPQATSRFTYEEPLVPTPALGNRIEKWLKTPGDILTFGPRATIGALVALPQRAQALQEALDNINMLLQDPRPLEDKRDELAKEVEAMLVAFVEKGAGVEADILASVVSLLPPEVKEQLPEELKMAVGRAGMPAASAPTPTSVPFADNAAVPTVTLETNKIAAEMADLREAVKELRGALDALAANADLAQDKILKTNLRDARASAALRVQQLSTSTTSSLDTSIQAAITEANALLTEVEGIRL